MASPPLQSFRTSKRGTYARGTVICPKCASGIHFYKLNIVGAEFSARCPKCGHRSFHDKRELTVEQLPDRRKKPRPE